MLRRADEPGVASALKPHALSQYMRCPADRANASMYWRDNACLMTDRTLLQFMGYSLRTAEWRYTEWAAFPCGRFLDAPMNCTSSADPRWDLVYGRELYK